MRERTWITDRFLRNDVHCSGNGRRAEQGGTASTHHFHTLYHIGRNLLQPIHTCQRGENGTRIYQYLGIFSIQAVDAYLWVAAILAIGLYPHTGLKDQSLRQSMRVCLFKQFRSDHFDQGRCQAPGSLATIGSNYHSIQCHHIFFQFKVLLQGLATFQNDFALLRLIPYSTDGQGKLTFGQIL